MKKILGFFAPFVILPTLVLAQGQQNVTIRDPVTGNTAGVNAGRELLVNASVSASVTGFTPGGTAATQQTATTSTARVALPVGTVVLLQNTGTTNAVYVKLGDNTVTATANDIYLGPGSSCAATVGANTNVAFLAAASTTTLNVTGGSGLGSCPTGGGGGSGGGGGNVNLTQVNSQSVNVGTGAAGTGTQRVTTSTDSTIATITNPVTVTDGAGALNVIVDSSALPSGAATAANQSTEISSLSTIATNTTGASTAANQTSVIGTKAAGTAATNSLLAGGVYNTSLPSPSNGQQTALQLDSSGRLIVNVGAGGGSGGTSSSFGSAFPSTGTAVGASDGTNMQGLRVDSSANLKVIGGYAQGSTTSGQTTMLNGCATTTNAPTNTTAQTNALNCDTSGALRVNVTSATGVAQGSTTSGQSISPIGCRTVSSSPTDTNAQTNMPTCDTSGNLRVNIVTGASSGAVAQGSTTSGQSVVPMGARTLSTTPTDTTAQTNMPVATVNGGLVVMPYSLSDTLVSGTITSDMTGTTSTSLISAPGASLRNYITQITCWNSHATQGTGIGIQDGSGGTTFYSLPAAAVYGGAVINFPAPLKQPTQNTALYVVNQTSGAATRCSASGFKAP